MTTPCTSRAITQVDWVTVTRRRIKRKESVQSTAVMVKFPHRAVLNGERV